MRRTAITGHNGECMCDACRAKSGPAFVDLPRAYPPLAQVDRAGRWAFVALVAIAMIALLAAGCSSRYEVQSDTSWSGFVDDHSVTGSGHATFSARPNSGASFSKSTEAGTLRARATGWHGDGQWASTSAPYGTVTVSTR